mgnify:CR=1 FL=1
MPHAHAGDDYISGFWPAFWLMGNLARPGERGGGWGSRRTIVRVPRTIPHVTLSTSRCGLKDVKVAPSSQRACCNAPPARAAPSPAGYLATTGGFWPYTVSEGAWE